MKTYRANYFARLGLAAASVLTASTFLARVNAAEPPSPSTTPPRLPQAIRAPGGTSPAAGLPKKFNPSPSAAPPPAISLAPAIVAPSLSPPLTHGAHERSTQAVLPRSGNYLVTINALWCGKATADDPLEFDGKGDEIYCAAYVRRYDRKTFQVLDHTFRQTREYGDASHSDRIQAGSRSPLGGIQDGDSIPDHASVARVVPAQESVFPLRVWQGTLTDGADALVISPSIWESDGEPSYFYKWAQKQMQLNDTLFLSSALQEQIRSRRFGTVELGATESAENLAATKLELLASTIPAALVGLPSVQFFLTGHDGPIGVLHDNSLNEQALPNTTVVLTREIIESALSSAFEPSVVNPDLTVLINVPKPGILIITFRDRPANGTGSGRWVNYSMALQVERLP